MSNSTLEKLPDVPRDKAIDGQGISSPGSINSKRARNTSSSDDDDDDDDGQAGQRQGDERREKEEDNGQEGMASRKEKVPEWYANGINMSGPVTDL